MSIWSLKNVKKRLAQIESLGINKQAYILLNKYSSHRNLDKEIDETLAEFGMPVLKTKIANRVAYKEAVLEGMGVIEYSDKKATAEINSLMSEIINLKELIPQTV